MIIKVIYVDIGCQGSISDGGVFRNSSLNAAIQDRSLNLPQPKPLPYNNDPSWYGNQCIDPVPFVFVGDDAFPLDEHIMKPYPQRNLDERKRIFNYRLSRLRRISENVFGIWVSRFRVFTTKILLSPDKATIISLAAVALHNMLQKKSRDSYIPDGFADEEDDEGNFTEGEWRKNSYVDFAIRGFQRGKNNKHKKSAENVRDIFADHFFGPGEIPWQWKILI